jgi:hypothetical protein
LAAEPHLSYNQIVKNQAGERIYASIHDKP